MFTPVVLFTVVSDFVSYLGKFIHLQKFAHSGRRPHAAMFTGGSWVYTHPQGADHMLPCSLEGAGYIHTHRAPTTCCHVHWRELCTPTGRRPHAAMFTGGSYTHPQGADHMLPCSLEGAIHTHGPTRNHARYP